MKWMYFYTDWCRLPKSYDLDVEEIDVVKDSDAAIKYDIKAVPTLLAVKGDEVHKKFFGKRSKADLKKILLEGDK